MILIAPSRRVRAEPPLPRDVETKLLLGQDPEQPTIPPPPRVEHPAPVQRRTSSPRSAGSAPSSRAPAQALTRGRRELTRSRTAGGPGSTPRRRPSRRPGPIRRARLSRSISTASVDLVAGPDHAPEAHVLDAAEQRQLSRVALVAEHRDRAGLRERLELQHAGKHRVARESGRRGTPRRRSRGSAPGPTTPGSYASTASTNRNGGRCGRSATSCVGVVGHAS